MTQEERIAQLEQENAELRAQLAEAYQQISQLAQRVQRLEGQLARFVVRRVRRPYVTFVAISLPCASKGIPCWLRWRLSLLDARCRLHGPGSSERRGDP